MLRHGPVGWVVLQAGIAGEQLALLVEDDEIGSEILEVEGRAQEQLVGVGIDRTQHRVFQLQSLLGVVDHDFYVLDIGQFLIGHAHPVGAAHHQKLASLGEAHHAVIVVLPFAVALVEAAAVVQA